MSGIAGVLSSQYSVMLPKILEKIDHQGTSSPMSWQGPNVTLGAIGLEHIDESPGPLTTPSGDRAIVMDGKISNCLGLQKELNFHTTTRGSDAEIILHAFNELGTRIFGRLEGELALIIVDGDHFMLARDRLGIKPLYYGFHADALCFASKIKGLVGVVD